MAARKTSGFLFALLSRLFRPLEGKAWLISASLVFCSILGVCSYHLWHKYGDQIARRPQYRLDPKRLSVTPQPPWIRSDVTENALTYGRLQDASLLDPRFVLQVRQAFGVQPWVRRVLRVNKRFPSTVEVDLEYRRPLAMVEVPAGMLPPYDYEGLLPIDREGYLLPVEMNEEEASSFPKITGVDTSPAGPPGSPWGDTRVAEAAEIVVLLQDLWDPLQLYQVEVPPRGKSRTDEGNDSFVLITRQRRRFDWGRPPGREAVGEDSAQEKISRLQKFFEKFGPLDALELSDEQSLGQRVGFRYGIRQEATRR